MNNNIPKFTEQEWEFMKDYRENSSKEPRQNLIELISHVDPGVAALGMNSGPYFAFDRLLTDEMIDFANNLELRKPLYIEELAKKAGKSIEYTAKMADDLCRVGVLVYHTDENGVDRIELPIFVVGSLEQTKLGGLNCDQFANYPELAVAFRKFCDNSTETKGALLPMANHGVHRPVPVESALKNESHVEPWERLEELIEKSANGSYAICECICRKNRKQYGELGNDPEINWCMPIGYYADYAVRTGKAKRVTKEEYYARLDEGTKRGLVHNVCNHEGTELIEYVCNCDYESCLSLRAGLYSGLYHMQKSNFVAHVDAEKCVACGACVEKCPANATRLGRKLPEKVDKQTQYNWVDLPVLQNSLSWDESHYDHDYLLHRSSIWSETGTAPCKTDCPAHIAVQGYLRMAALGKYDEALELIKRENPLPAVCGTICNHRCESVCTRGDIDEAVSIDEVKKFIAYRELKEKDRFVPEKLRTEGTNLAVIGSGPAGISCAYYLAIEGHQVTVFDKAQKPGGMMANGIPSFRLEKDVVEAEIDVLRALGVEFKCGVEVGKDVTIAELREQGYKAFYLGVGLQDCGKLGIPGDDAEGVIGGVDFVKKVNGGEDIKLSGKVVVIGGGNIGSDVARTAKRCGADKVDLYCLEDYESMPMGDEDKELCTSEGITLHAGWGQTEVLTENGKCTGIKFRKCLSVKNAEGRFDPKFDDAVTETAECNTVLFCIGQRPQWGDLLKDTKVELSSRGFVVADPLTYQTAEPDIFAGGDIYTGQKFCIDAIAAGKQGAISMHRFAWDNNLKSGRTNRDFKYIDKDNIGNLSYDTTPRQKPAVDASKRMTMRDERGVFTEEQVKAETARCLKCGAAHVDENRCFGCGVCTTRCKFDAITLYKKYNDVPVPNELLARDVAREVGRRIDAKYKNPIVNKVVKKVVKKKAAAPKITAAEPRKW